MNIKRGLSVFIASLMLFGCTAYGAGISSIGVAKKNAIGVAENEADKASVRVITYDEAVKMAIKNNSTLKTLEANLETLLDGEAEIDMALGLMSLPGMPPNQSFYIDSTTATLLTSLNTIQNSMATIEDSKKMTEDGCVLAVKSYMGDIKKAESNLKLMAVNLEMTRTNTHFSRMKYDMGMISATELQKAINDGKNVELTYNLCQLALDTAYNNLGNIIGLNKGQEFVIDYNVQYEIYPVQKDLSKFANKITDADPSLKIADREVDNAEFKKKVLAVDNGTSLEDINKELDEAGRKYNDTRNSLLLAVKNGYIAVKQAEANIETLKLNVENAKAQYENAKMSRDMGYITDMELTGAGLAVTSAENELESAILAHDMAKFMVEHPYLSTSSASAQR